MRDLRRHADLTQEQAAVLAGLTRNTIMSLESSEVPDPRLSTLLKLMRLYKVGSLDELLGVSASVRLLAWIEESDTRTVRPGEAAQ